VTQGFGREPLKAKPALAGIKLDGAVRAYEGLSPPGRPHFWAARRPFDEATYSVQARRAGS
jgi:hypothetical protein